MDDETLPREPSSAVPPPPPGAPAPSAPGELDLNLDAARALAGVREPKPRSSGQAVGALATAIAGFFFCGPILGIVALVLASAASRAIRESNGRLGGAGMVTAARIIAVIDIVVFFVVLGFVLRSQ